MEEKIRSVIKEECITAVDEDGYIHYYHPQTGEEVFDPELIEEGEEDAQDAACPCGKKYSCPQYTNTGRVCPLYMQPGCQCKIDQDDNDKEEPKEDDKPGEDKEPKEDGEPKGEPGSEPADLPGPNPTDTAEGLGDAAANATKVTASAGAPGAVGVSGAPEALEAAPLVGEGAVPVLVGCLIALLIIVILVVIFLVLMAIFPEEASGTTTDTPTTICLDPGHSPHPKNGKTGAPGEMELNWQTANEVKALLEADGYKVVLTRTENEDVPNGERPKRCQAAGAPFLYAIHHNDAPGKKGPFHIIPKSSRKKIYDTSKKEAEIIQDTIVKELGVEGKTSGDQPVDGGICVEGTSCTSDNLEIVSAGEAIGMPVMYIEIMALNGQGTDWIKNPTNRAKMNKGIAEGIKKAAPKGGANGQKIAQTAVDYTKNMTLFYKDAVNGGKYGNSCGGGTDCGGFVATVIWKTGFDPDFVAASKSLRAHAYADYFKKHPEKYQIISENLKDTKSLKPGDILVRTSGGSHTAIYVGEVGKNAGGSNKAEASCGDHDPDIAHNWYDGLNFAARMIK